MSCPIPQIQVLKSKISTNPNLFGFGCINGNETPRYLGRVTKQSIKTNCNALEGSSLVGDWQYLGRSCGYNNQIFYKITILDNGDLYNNQIINHTSVNIIAKSNYTCNDECCPEGILETATFTVKMNEGQLVESYQACGGKVGTPNGCDGVYSCESSLGEDPCYCGSLYYAPCFVSFDENGTVVTQCSSQQYIYDYTSYCSDVLAGRGSYIERAEINLFDEIKVEKIGEEAPKGGLFSIAKEGLDKKINILEKNFVYNAPNLEDYISPWNEGQPSPNLNAQRWRIRLRDYEKNVRLNLKQEYILVAFSYAGEPPIIPDQCITPCYDNDFDGTVLFEKPISLIYSKENLKGDYMYSNFIEFNNFEYLGTEKNINFCLKIP